MEEKFKELISNPAFCMKLWEIIHSSAYRVLGGPSVLANKSIEIADKCIAEFGGDTSFIG